MNSFESMKTKLEKTGLYNVKNGTNIRAELCAYAAGLDVVFNELEKAERELFIDTAEDYGISERERFLGKLKDDCTLEKRRSMLKVYEKMIGGKCTPKAFSEMLRGYGVENFEFIEDWERFKLGIKIKDSKTDTEKALIAEHIGADFPIHLLIAVSYTDE